MLLRVMILSHLQCSCLTYSGVGERCYSPALFCHQSICRNAQSYFTVLESNMKSGFLISKMAVVLSHNLQLRFDR